MAMSEDLLLEDIIFTTGLDTEISKEKEVVEFEADNFDFGDRFDMDFGRDDFGF